MDMGMCAWLFMIMNKCQYTILIGSPMRSIFVMSRSSDVPVVICIACQRHEYNIDKAECTCHGCKRRRARRIWLYTLIQTKLAFWSLLACPSRKSFNAGLVPGQPPRLARFSSPPLTSKDICHGNLEKLCKHRDKGRLHPRRSLVQDLQGDKPRSSPPQTTSKRAPVGG